MLFFQNSYSFMQYSRYVAGKLQELPYDPISYGNTQLQNKKIKCLGRTSKVQAI